MGCPNGDNLLINDQVLQYSIDPVTCDFEEYSLFGIANTATLCPKTDGAA